MLDLPLASYWYKTLHPQASRLVGPVDGWFYAISPAGDISLSLLALIILGLTVGLLVGFFGVGGGFLMTPLLNLMGHIPYNVAIGTDLSQMVGVAVTSNLRQLGSVYIDYKLAFLMFAGSFVGVECGAQLLEILKGSGSFSLGGRSLSVLQLFMTLVYGLLLLWIGSLIYREARACLKEEPACAAPGAAEGGGLMNRLRSLNLAPYISLPASGVDAISLWVVLAVGWVSGLLTGLLGVSGGFIRMPALIYVLGVPTVVSIGTNLFEMLLSSLYGAFTHGLKGNVEVVLVFVLLITSTIGTQVGAVLQRLWGGPRLQMAFAFLIFAVIALMVGGLVFC